jgi:glycosyltransferase involved in cell wall biosynthesis
MNVSIAIATFNRATELQLTLITLTRLQAHEVDDWEIVVVGNNCSDETANVVASFIPEFEGRLRYVEEFRQGLSHARNRALIEARFEIIAFLDDDVDVDPYWLDALVKTFRAEDCAAVGGRAYLVYPHGRPQWLSEKREGLLSKVEHGTLRRRAMPDELFGVNLSFRREWFERVGNFRIDLGRTGTCLIGDEDVEMLERIAAAGGNLVYEPAALVGHRVAPSRLSRRWFWSRCYWGKWGAARTEANPISPLVLLRWSTWLLLRTSGSLWKEAIGHGLQSPEVFYQTTRWASHLGTWVGSILRLWRRGKEVLARRFGGIITSDSAGPVSGSEKASHSPVEAANL